MRIVNPPTQADAVHNLHAPDVAETQAPSPADNIINSDELRIVVEAGPGTGKSYALRLRVQRLILGGAPPSRIMAVTFTRTAANDIRRELSQIVHDDGQDLYAGTLHGFCFGTLATERYFEANGRVPRPLLTSSRSANLGFEAAPMLSDLNCHVYKGLYGTATSKSKAIRLFEAAWAKDQDAVPEIVSTEEDIQFNQDVISWLSFHNAILLGELIPLALQYLRTNPLAPELERFDHVLVDEYQDLNRAEQHLLDLMSEQANSVVVGDIDQSIYSFRHAQPNGLTDFPSRHQEAVTMTLDLCRRCPQGVVALASAIIGHNYNPIESNRLLPHEGNVEGDISFRQWRTVDDQLQGAFAYIQWLINEQQLEPKDILVLSPSRKLGYGLRRLLRLNSIEAQSYFTEEALEEDDAQRAFTLLTLLVRPDDRVALRTWLGRGSGTHNRREYGKLRLHCEQHQIAPAEALEQLLANDTLAIPNLLASYRDLKNVLEPLSQLIGSGLVDALFPIQEDWANDFRAMAGTPIPETLSAGDLYSLLLEQITQPGLPTNVEHVRIMSLHKAKGLTARATIIIGCVNGLLPRDWNPAKTPLNESEHEREQRRLLYVAVTRTTQYLLVSGFQLVPKNVALNMGMPPGSDAGANYRYTMSRFFTLTGLNAPRFTSTMTFPG